MQFRLTGEVVHQIVVRAPSPKAGPNWGIRVGKNRLAVQFTQSCGAKELYLWFEPRWHVGCATGIVLGSRQAQVEDKDAHAQLGKVAAQLDGRRIETADLDAITYDIQLRFSGGYWLRTFVSDPADEEIWFIRDNSKGLIAGASPAGYFARAAERFVPPYKK